MNASKETCRYLKWERVTARLDQLAVTTQGKAKVQTLPFLNGGTEVRNALEAVHELKTLFDNGENLHFGEMEDLSALVFRARKEGTLSALELLLVGRTVQDMTRVRNFAVSHQARLSHSVRIINRMAELRLVGTEIFGAIDSEGMVKDNASPELHRARQRAFSVHQDIKVKLERFLRTQRADEALQDKFYTLREDRYVVPVRAERQGSVEGIVHAVSQSGATVFIEPDFLIPLNNQLKWAQETVKQAEAVVLGELTDVVADNGAEILATQEAVGDFDVLSARALLAVEMGASIPEIGDKPLIRLMGARSPILLLQGSGVVANDFLLGNDGCQLICLSGPNAGGKSVALKTLGQCLLMVSAGLLPPVGADSVVPVLKGLHALPGDLEDVSQQLSTFTGHLTGLNQILEQCGPGHLVLVDEITVGTEPEQGAALGGAYLNAFMRSGTLAMIATHYERLKGMAMATDGMENASMGVNWETLEPTYRLSLGVPGSSRTLEIARRVGVPEEVIEDTAAFLSGEKTGTLEEAILRLSSREEELERQVKEASALTLEAQELARRRRLALDELSKRTERIVNQKVRLATQAVDEAMGTVNELVAEMTRKEQTRGIILKNRRRLSEVNEEIQKRRKELEQEEALEPYRSQTASHFEEGGEVLVKKFGKKAVVMSLSEKDNSALLKMGPMRMRLPLSDLVPLKQEKGSKPASEPQKSSRTAMGLGSQRLDLRGKTGEEALEDLISALDNAILSPTSEIIAVHGHGTGRLKQVVRDYLKETSYPVEFRPGKREEGGDGVTIISIVT